MSNPRPHTKSKPKVAHRKNAAPAKHHRRRNPAFPKVVARHRRRNPSEKFELKSLMVGGAGAIAGAMGTRSLAQIVAGAYNSGLIGYALNIGIAGAGGWLLSKYNRDFGYAFAIGGIAATALRAWNATVGATAPVTAALSGLGDPEFSSTGLGDIVTANPPLPYIPRVATPALPATSVSGTAVTAPGARAASK